MSDATEAGSAGRFRGRLRRFLKRKLGFLKDRIRFPRIRRYRPSKIEMPAVLLDEQSAWRGLESIVPAIIKDFKIGTDSCLEFGVEFGYSTVAFSNLFSEVTGVDIFLGDEHTIFHGDHFEVTSTKLSRFENIHLHKNDFRDWIKNDQKNYDLVHVDIVHTYEATYECGLWSARHSTCTLFHDTESFPEVRRAVYDIARQTKKRFYNYPLYHGLGIVV